MSEIDVPPQLQTGRGEEHNRKVLGREGKQQNFVQVIDFERCTRPKRQIGQREEVNVSWTKTTHVVNLDNSAAPVLSLEPCRVYFRWIHIPVNHAGIAEAIVNTLIGENASQHLRGTCQQKLRPAISGSVRVPAHAWSMEPSVQEPREFSVRREATQVDDPLLPIYDVAGMTAFSSLS